MKSLYTTIFFLILLSTSCSSQQGQPLPFSTPVTEKREDTLRRKVPQEIGYINDFTGIFTQSQRLELDSIVRTYERQTKVEIAIATVDSGIIKDGDFEDFSLVMANTWGIGKKELANGILILIAVDMQRLRIQTGKGIAKVLSNEETKAIISQVIFPQYAKGNLFEGTKQGLLAIITKLPKNGY